MELAYNDWNTSEGTLSIRKATRQYGLAKGALDRRIHRRATKKQVGEKRRRISNCHIDPPSLSISRQAWEADKEDL